MRVTIRPRLDPAPLEAFTASIAGWIAALLVWFCGMLDALPPEAQRNPALRAGVA